jgi:hypothetical protein
MKWSFLSHPLGVGAIFAMLAISSSLMWRLSGAGLHKAARCVATRTYLFLFISLSLLFPTLSLSLHIHIPTHAYSSLSISLSLSHPRSLHAHIDNHAHISLSVHFSLSATLSLYIHTVSSQIRLRGGFGRFMPDPLAGRIRRFCASMRFSARHFIHFLCG